jgi:hypothetical protein
MRKIFVNMNAIQSNLNITNVESLADERVIFSLIDTIKSFKGDINNSSKEYNPFFFKI